MQCGEGKVRLDKDRDHIDRGPLGGDHKVDAGKRAIWAMRTSDFSTSSGTVVVDVGQFVDHHDHVGHRGFATSAALLAL